ncbi:MAG: CopG family transcriptional regulator [Endomicrobium sp.]|jgi:RHH-type rel operon transcriptional repressor/antitoxin RelB|nr:CopG family transcriptional regulator [Endomicrobium sp.]
MQIKLELEDYIVERLENLAKKKGYPKTYYASKAIVEFLEDLEDFYIAKRRVDDINNGREKTITLEEVKKRYGL